MNKKILALLVVLLFVLTSAAVITADENPPKKKQTTLGLYITAGDAFTQWYAAPEKVKIIDVRSPSEYVFVGHAPMAANIPVRFFNETFDPQTMKPGMPLNEKFVAEVKKRFRETDVLLVMCRSGGRSAAAVNILANAGFKNVYNITDGFEGDTLTLPGSCSNGKRIVNGWKNAGAPWTYDLDPKLVYMP